MMVIMRTTISISDELLHAAKERARRLGQTLGDVVDAALRRELGRADTTPPPDIPTFRKGTGPAPGVDLSSNRALIELLDEDLPLDQRR